MLEPLATRLAVSAEPHLEVVPFVCLTCDGFDAAASRPLGVRVQQVVGCKGYGMHVRPERASVHARCHADARTMQP